jgi:hypothetical protein
MDSVWVWKMSQRHFRGSEKGCDIGKCHNHFPILEKTLWHFFGNFSELFISSPMFLNLRTVFLACVTVWHFDRTFFWKISPHLCHNVTLKKRHTEFKKQPQNVIHSTAKNTISKTMYVWHFESSDLKISYILKPKI